MRLSKACILLGLGLLPACHKDDAPNAQNFALAINAYLAERGELCVGKTEWPIDVSERESELGTRDARQMPVLERLGLVRSSDAVSERKSEDEVYQVRVKRYQLTQAGQQFYRQRSVKDERGEPHPSGDLCAARLSLDKIAHFELGRSARGHETALVSYTYHVAPAPWTLDPDVQSVFPAVTRVLRGAEHDELSEGLTLTPQGWVADDRIGSSGPGAPAQLSAR